MHRPSRTQHVEQRLQQQTLSDINGTRARRLPAPSDAAGSQDRFLKLLVTQLKNQDPLSPMDNAQLTSQIAQINTVSGIATLNTSVQTLSTQFLQMQSLQGACAARQRCDRGRATSSTSTQRLVGQGGFELTSRGRRGEGGDRSTPAGKRARHA